ncbi:hypothetical protein [Anatilimnocola floriformis]|uniref:hypothetical protein n=1 Tax=Anatilimnocola floriformis TaxID=2948575 RepID=UPI0020C3379D|nr:hypothetical protein [Anatilimnocola floriformis]
MTSPLYFLPVATAAVTAGASILQEAVGSAASAGSAFADMLAGKTEEEDDDKKKIDDNVDKPGDPSAILNLVDQIQNGIQAKLQSMGLNLDSDLTLSIDNDGKVQIAGDSDSAAMLEQIINSDPKLQSKMASLKRAAKGSGQADQLEAKLKYEQGRVQLQVQQPADDNAAAGANAASAAGSAGALLAA